jgi:nitrate reductase (NAD(P)H)
LTGVHPFNVEPPLTALYKEGMEMPTHWETKCPILIFEGFLTSPELFYVRNHGPVPEVHDEDIPTWELSIEGSVVDYNETSTSICNLTKLMHPID